MSCCRCLAIQRLQTPFRSITAERTSRKRPRSELFKAMLKVIMRARVLMRQQGAQSHLSAHLPRQLLATDHHIRAHTARLEKYHTRRVEQQACRFSA